jgi:hypothetical protein
MRVPTSEPSLPSIAPTTSTPAPTGTARPEASSFSEVLRGLGREIDRGEKTMRVAMESVRPGTELGPMHLLALQAGVYRYSEAIDLASRLVDRAVGGVKTIVQGGNQ